MGSVVLAVWILLACTPIYTGQDKFWFRIVIVINKLWRQLKETFRTQRIITLSLKSIKHNYTEKPYQVLRLPAELFLNCAGSTSPELKSKIPLVTATASNVWAGKAAWRAIDGNYGTYSLAGPNKEQETWFTVTLDKVHCVAMVTVFWESYFPEVRGTNSWILSGFTRVLIFQTKIERDENIIRIFRTKILAANIANPMFC